MCETYNKTGLGTLLKNILGLLRHFVEQIFATYGDNCSTRQPDHWSRSFNSRDSKSFDVLMGHVLGLEDESEDADLETSGRR